MAPTICSGKKHQTRTIATTTNIRRHGQGSHELNQALSNIVNFVGKSSLNPKVTPALRIQNSHNQTERNSRTTGNHRTTNTEASSNYNHLQQHTNDDTSASNNHRQQNSSQSDNTTRSDTENLFDLRMANAILSNDSIATYDSNTTNTSSSSSSLSEAISLPSIEKKMSSPTSECQQSLFHRFSAVRNDRGGSGGKNSENEATHSHENENRNALNSNIKIKISEMHPNNRKKYYFSCNDFDSDEDELNYTREFDSDISTVGSDNDMETDESDSMTSFDTEKSAELKKGNHPLLRDGLIAAEQLYNSSSNKKSSTNTPNRDGLLSIAIKTIKLVKRNQLLQQRLMQLQQETSEFIQSVLANPENQHFRENTKQKV